MKKSVEKGLDKVEKVEKSLVYWTNKPASFSYIPEGLDGN